MKWVLNTNKACKASELEANLKAELVHFSKTQPEGRALKEVPDVQPIEMGVTDPVEIRRIFAEVDARRKEVSEAVSLELPAVQKQALAAIEAVVAVALTMGSSETKFHATVAGHHDVDREDGVDERVNIGIDIAG